MIRNRDDKELKHFQLFFGPAVMIIQDGKKSSPIRSDAYFPELKPALQSNRMFFCEQYCNIAMQCCNIDVQVARSKLQSL